jgi:hypothetical protein
LQGRKKSGKSRFDEEKAAINLQLRSKHRCGAGTSQQANPSDTKKSNFLGAAKQKTAGEKSNSPGAKKPPFRPPGAKKTVRQRLMPVIPSPHQNQQEVRDGILPSSFERR